MTIELRLLNVVVATGVVNQNPHAVKQVLESAGFIQCGGGRLDYKTVEDYKLNGVKIRLSWRG